MKSLSILSTLALLALALTCSAQQISIDPELRHGTLKNGMTYYARRAINPAQSADFYLVCRAGSVNEHEDERGLAHLLEHIFFAGTRNFPESAFEDYLQNNGLNSGAFFNAQTGYDHIRIQVSNIPTQRQAMLDSVLLFLQDVACNLSIDKAAVEKQKLIVEQERINSNYAYQRLANQQIGQAFRGTRFATRSPIGLKEVVTAATPEKLRAYYQRWFQPQNLAVIAVGDFDPEIIEQNIIRIFGKLKPDHGKAEIFNESLLQLPRQDKPEVFHFSDPEVNSTHLNFCIKLPYQFSKAERNTMDFVRYETVKNLLAIAVDTRLNDIIESPECPILNIEAIAEQFAPSRTQDVINIATEIYPTFAKYTTQSITAELFRLKKHGLTPSELEYAKQIYRSNINNYSAEVEKHDTKDYTDEYFRHFMDGGYIPGVVKECETDLQLTDQISLGEVNAMLSKSIKPENLFITRITIPDEPELPTDSILLCIDTISALPLQPYIDQPVPQQLLTSLPAPGKITKTTTDNQRGITTLTLSNGIKVHLKPTTLKDNEILVDITAPGGFCSFDTTQAVALQLMSDVVENSRIGGNTALQVSKYLRLHQASTLFSVNEDSRNIQGGTGNSELETLFQLCHLYFTDIAPDTAAYQKHKIELINNRFVADAKPETQLTDIIFEQLYDNSPFMRRPKHDEIFDTDFEQVLSLYKTLIARPQDYVFSFVGSFNVDSIRPLIETYIASLPTPDIGQPIPVEYPMCATTQDSLYYAVTTLPEGKLRMSSTTYGNLPFNQTNHVMMEFYDNFLSAELNHVLREEMQATYGVDANATLFPSGQYLTAIQFDTFADFNHLDSLYQTVNFIRDYSLADIELARVAANIEEVRIFIKNMLKAKQQQNTYWLNAMHENALGYDLTTNRDAIIDSITALQLQEFFHKLKYAGCVDVVQVSKDFKPSGQ